MSSGLIVLGSRILRCYYAAVVLFMYAPLIVLVIFSFNASTVPSFPLAGFTLQWYGDFLHNSTMLSSLRASAMVGVLSSLTAVALGTAASYGIVRYRFRGRAMVTALLLTPLVLPYLVVGVALLLFFKAAGVSPSLWTVVIGHVVLILPYSVLIIAPRLAEVRRDIEEAARDLGATPMGAFWRVTRPMITPALVSASIIGFTISFDEYAVASFVIGHQSTFPVYLYSSLRFASALPQVIAVAVVVLATSFLFIIASESVEGAHDRWRSRAE